MRNLLLLSFTAFAFVGCATKSTAPHAAATAELKAALGRAEAANAEAILANKKLNDLSLSLGKEITEIRSDTDAIRNFHRRIDTKAIRALEILRDGCE